MQTDIIYITSTDISILLGDSTFYLYMNTQEKGEKRNKENSSFPSYLLKKDIARRLTKLGITRMPNYEGILHLLKEKSVVIDTAYTVILH